MEPQSWVSVARVIRPQGRRGEVLAEVLTDFPERFGQMREAFLARAEKDAPTPITIENAWLHKDRVVLKFAEIDSISAAESLRGADLVIPASERVPLEADAFYIGDLIGCSVIDSNNSEEAVVGTVRDVIQQGKTTDLLLVRGSDGAQHSIPFAKAYVVRIDLKRMRVELNLPHGLLAVNAPLTEEERRDQRNETELPGNNS